MQKLFSSIRRTFLLTSMALMLTVGILFSSCKTQPKSEEAKPTTNVESGKLIKAEKIGEFDTAKLNRILHEELRQFLTGSPMPYENFKDKYNVPHYSVTLYKLTYQSMIPEMDNKPAETTGLVAIPSTLAPGTPMVSYQHGTVFGKTEVPSHLDESMETKLMVAQFGGQGYIVIGADYHGLGESTLPNSYIIRKSTEQACMDMYKATQEFLSQQKINVEHFFTLGWSQGGWNNLIFLRQLEKAKIPVTASVSACSPTDVNTFVTNAAVNPRPIDAIWMPAAFSNLLFAYENYYGLKDLTKRAIRPQYLQAAKDFYEFKIDFPEYLKKSTGSIKEMANPEFIEELKRGDGDFSKVLNESEGYRWLSTTPLRNYYGLSDEAIPPYLGKLSVEYQTFLGKKNGEAILAGEKADHRAAYAFSVIDAKPWFDSFLKK